MCYGTTHTDTLSQKVSIPSTCTTATFTVLTTLATFSNLNAASGYTQHSYSLKSYIGQTITLKFTGSEDASLQTSLRRLCSGPDPLHSLLVISP